MTWRIRMSDTDSAGRVIPSSSRVLAYEAPSKAHAFTFADNVLTAMVKSSFRRLPQFEIFEEAEAVPQEPVP